MLEIQLWHWCLKHFKLRQLIHNGAGHLQYWRFDTPMGFVLLTPEGLLYNQETRTYHEVLVAHELVVHLQRRWEEDEKTLK